jgi:AcrR family transcriptional regulator
MSVRPRAVSSKSGPQTSKGADPPLAATRSARRATASGPGSPSPKVRRAKTAKGELSRDNLLEAAGRVFKRQGFSATTVRDIAAEAGLALGGIYRHFSSKDEFVACVLCDGVNQIDSAVRRAVANLGTKVSVQQEIRAGIRAQILAMRQHGDSFDKAIRYQRVSKSPPEVWKDYRAAVDRYRLFWKDLIESGQRRGQIRSDAPSTLLTFYLLGAATWVQQWHSPSRRSVDQIADDFSAWFIQGAAA